MLLRLRLLPLRRLFGSVRMRLTLWYLAILAVVFLVFGVAVTVTVLHEDQITEQDALITTAQQVAATYGTDGLLHVNYPWTDRQTLPFPPPKTPLGKQLPLGPQDIALLLDTQGTLTQRFGPVSDVGIAHLEAIVANLSMGRPGPPQRLDNFFSVQLSLVEPLTAKVTTTEYLVYITGIQSQGRQMATLLVASPSAYTHTLNALVPGLLIAGPLTLLVAALGGYWLASRAMRPVRTITRTAQEIGETDLSRRLNLKRRDELGELAATFDRMLDRLQSAFARQRQFTADASHELRTPLAIVGLEVDRGLASRRTPEEYERILATIQLENTYMSRLVNDLLTLARADAGRSPLRLERVDVSDVALETVERLASLARARGIVLVTGDLPELHILGDRVYLAQMLANLVENAVKYTAGIGSRVSVSVGRTDQGGSAWAWARITDDGPGIPAEHLPHIFDRFYRVDGARNQGMVGTPDGVSGGSGLGLAVVRWVAEVHGGTVSVQSGPDAGSTFEVRLPLAA
jgi:signal transduction histidine kinase